MHQDSKPEGILEMSLLISLWLVSQVASASLYANACGPIDPYGLWTPTFAMGAIPLVSTFAMGAIPLVSTFAMGAIPLVSTPATCNPKKKKNLPPR